MERAAPSPAFETRRWTRLEYDRLIDVGPLDEDDPIELVWGHLVVREPQSSPHATATMLANDALRRVFTRGWQVRVGLPLALGRDSEPEPDVSVVRPLDHDRASWRIHRAACRAVRQDCRERSPALTSRA